MNYLERVARREILAITDGGEVRADLIAGTVETAGETEAFSCARDTTYMSQLGVTWRGGDGCICSQEEGEEVLRMIDAAERSARESVWVMR